MAAVHGSGEPFPAPAGDVGAGNACVGVVLRRGCIRRWVRRHPEIGVVRRVEVLRRVGRGGRAVHLRWVGVGVVSVVGRWRYAWRIAVVRRILR
jgi:hypothetical protein